MNIWELSKKFCLLIFDIFLDLKNEIFLNSVFAYLQLWVRLTIEPNIVLVVMVGSGFGLGNAFFPFFSIFMCVLENPGKSEKILEYV